MKIFSIERLKKNKYKIIFLGIKLSIGSDFQYYLTRIYAKNKLLIKFLDLIFPKDKTKVIFTSYPDFSDSAYLFYEFLKDKKQTKFKKIIWLKDKKTSKHQAVNDKTYFIYSLLGIWHLITAKYIIHDHCNLFLDFLKSGRHVLFNLWHGSPIKAIGMLDDEVLPKTRKRYNFMAKYSYWFVTSDIYKIIISSTFQINPKKIYITGIVKTDIIFKSDKDKYIKKCFNLDGFSKTILYAPTYKARGANRVDVEIDTKNLFCFKEYDRDDFIKYLKENNICLIIKPHPFEETDFIKFLNRNCYNQNENIRIITTNALTTNGINLNEVFGVTDLIISDFSSITVDYAISKKPILYLTNYLQNYQEGRGFILPDNLKILMPGETVSNYQELKEKASFCLRNNNANYSEKELKLIYKYLDGNSCERIFEIMKNL